MIPIRMLKIKSVDKNSLFYTYFLPFTVLFIIVQFFVFFVFYSNNITFIWNYDGAYQHYPALSYYSSMLKNLLSGKGLAMVDFSIGQGYDVIGTLNYYTLGDPLTLLAAIWNPDHLEALYDFLIILRFYLAGISFLMLCIYKKKAPFETILGSLIYIFSSYALVAGIKHPFFLNPMIYLPLLLIGIEQVLKRKRSLFFSFIVAISALSNFYFLYMLTIIIFIYALVLFNNYYKENRLKMFWTVFWRAVLYYLLGILLSSIILLPMLFAFLNNGRITGTANDINLLLYPFNYYKRLYENLFSLGFQAGYWSYISVGIVSFYSVFSLFSKKRKNYPLYIFLSISVLFLCVPIFGKIFNGFAYVANRWSFAWVLLIAYIVVECYEDLYELSLKKKYILLGLCLIHCCYAFLFAEKYMKLPALFLLAGAIFLIIYKHFKPLLKYRNQLFMVLCITNIVSGSYLFYDLKFWGYAEDYLAKGMINQYEQNDAIDYLKTIDTDFYRVQIDDNTNPNISILQNFYGTGFYFSILSKDVLSYMTNIENPSLRFTIQYKDYNERAALNTLNIVKYFITNRQVNVPFGYSELATNIEFKDGAKIYKNDYFVPLGFTYKQYITTSDYMALNSLEKQETLLQAVVLEDDITLLPKANLHFTANELPATLTFDEGMYLDGNNLFVTNDNSTLTIKTSGKDYSETYLRLENLQLISGKSTAVRLVSTSKRWRDIGFILRSRRDSGYFGMDNFLINLGYHNTAQQQVNLLFQAGEYKLDTVKLFSMPMSKYKKQVLKLNTTVLEDIQQFTNEIRGKITTTNPSLLYLTIPYSKGWSASVDGKPAPLIKANTMYTGLELTAGSHNIVLSYCTPYLKEGAVLSMIGVCITISIIFAPKFIKQRKQYLKQTTK